MKLKLTKMYKLSHFRYSVMLFFVLFVSKTDLVCTLAFVGL